MNATTAQVSPLPRILAGTLRTLAAIEERRSIRSFKPDKVDELSIKALLKAAVLAPTARHLEPWAFVVIQDPALLRRIADRAAEAPLSPAAALHEKHTTAPGPANLNIFHGASTLIVICARPLGPFAAADCWLAAENLMLEATGTGLGTCCIGSAAPALNSPDLKAELGIPPDVDVVAPIIVGVPAAVPPATGRKEPVILSWK